MSVLDEVDKTPLGPISNIVRQQEAFLEGLIMLLNITREEFIRDYILEVHKPAIVATDDQFLNEELKFAYQQKIVVRHKTVEELKYSEKS
jgi:hypothetical protein